MFIITGKEWRLLDLDRQAEDKPLPAGKHEFERIDNHYVYRDKKIPWLVLKGTRFGRAEEEWRSWSKPEYEDWEVKIEE